MRWRLIVRQQARLEPAEAIDWYQLQQPGLGERFLRAFLDAVDRLLDNPYRFQSIDDEIRRVRLKDFPYSLLHFLEESNIVIVACAHARRRPGYWRARLRTNDV